MLVGGAYVTSSHAAVAATLLFVVCCAAFVVFARRRTGRTALPALACLLWAATLAQLHREPSQALGWWLAATALTVASFLPRSDSSKRALVAVFGLVAGCVVVLVVQFVGLAAVFGIDEDVSVGLGLHNGSDRVVALNWRDGRFGRGHEGIWLTVPAGGARREWRMLASVSASTLPRAGELLLCAGGDEPLEIAVEGPPAAHFAVRVDADGRVLLRIGASGCWGAPRFGDEREVGRLALGGG